MISNLKFNWYISNFSFYCLNIQRQLFREFQESSYFWNSKRNKRTCKGAPKVLLLDYFTKLLLMNVAIHLFHKCIKSDFPVATKMVTVLGFRFPKKSDFQNNFLGPSGRTTKIELKGTVACNLFFYLLFVLRCCRWYMCSC